MIYLKKIIKLLFLIYFFLLVSCGTLLIKPNHSFSKHSDNLDYKVIFLDSLGLVLLVIPGVVALSIDYITGTIYLTEEENKRPTKGIDPKEVRNLIISNYPKISQETLNQMMKKITNLQLNYN